MAILTSINSPTPPANTDSDPHKWSQKDVEHWLQWAMKEFSLNPIDLSQFPFSGSQLVSLSREEFIRRAPPYAGDLLFLHLSMLLKGRSGEQS